MTLRSVRAHAAGGDAVSSNRYPMPEVVGVSHREVQVPDVTIHVAEAGLGEPIVLLHGWPQNWFCWRHVVPLLADRYRLIMPDLRGHGWSSAPRRGYDKEQLATDLLGLLDALGLSSVRLVGHDWGGWTGFLACLRDPGRFSSFLALGIVHPFQTPTIGSVVQSWRAAYQVFLSAPVIAEAALRASPVFVAAGIRAGIADGAAIPAAERRRYAEIFQDPARARATVQLYRTFLLRELPNLGRYRRQRLRVPTRLIIGDRDPVAAAAFLDGWQAHADDMTVDVLAGAGHFLPEERPHDVAAAIKGRG